MERRELFIRSLALGAASGGFSLSAQAAPVEAAMPVSATRLGTIKVGETEVFYREAGLPGAPALLLLHGFANSSHYFRHLLPRLAGRFHLIAPDLPTFGFTTVPKDGGHSYTFASLTETISGFVDAVGLHRYALYVFDYGAPVGFNLAVASPERITGIVTQNGNAYEDGLGAEAWAPLRAYWKHPSADIRDKLRSRMSFEGVRRDYFHGVPNPAVIEPEAYWLDAALLAQPGMMDIQIDLKLDYRSNIERYPLYQRYLKAHRPPVLAIWGRNDRFFIPPGAEAFSRDVPEADIRLLDTGHFALETNLEEIASAILKMPLRT